MSQKQLRVHMIVEEINSVEAAIKCLDGVHVASSVLSGIAAICRDAGCNPFSPFAQTRLILSNMLSDLREMLNQKVGQ